MPANGFSCSRQPGRTCRRRGCIISMISIWWSVARLAFSKIGAISYWRGATSLCRVLTGTPSLNSSASASSHAGQHALGDGAEVLVFQLLALGRLGAEEGAAGVDQVGPGVVEVLVDQEVFLLGADGGEDLRGLALPNSFRMRSACLRQRLHRAQQRRLLVERLAGPAREGGRDDERRAVGVLQDEGRAGRVPGGVAAGLERGADAAGGEASGVRLALDQFLAAELGDGPAVVGRARGSCRASRRSGRSSAGTGGCSGSPPSRCAQSFIAAATASATVGSSGAPFLIVFCSALYTLRQPLPHHLVGEDVDAEELADRRLLEADALAVGLPGGDRRDGPLAGEGLARHVVAPHGSQDRGESMRVEATRIGGPIGARRGSSRGERSPRPGSGRGASSGPLQADAGSPLGQSGGGTTRGREAGSHAAAWRPAPLRRRDGEIPLARGGL